MHRRTVLRACVALPLTFACGRRSGEDERKSDGKFELVLKYQPLGAARYFAELCAQHASTSGVRVVAETLPNASDLAHQFFLTALGGGSRDFDLFIVDTVWVSEFARAGFLLDLSREFAPDVVEREFLPGPAEAVVSEGKTYALPWYADVGVLYRRVDLVPEAPATYKDLIFAAERVLHQQRELRGYVWQGRQYEGLVCNVYEAIWGHRGKAVVGDRVTIDTREAERALSYLRSLVDRGISPASVSSAAEEDSRRIFQDGRAVFMRNWPYAYTEAEKHGSKIRGRVEMSALPTQTGEPGSGALGGYHLAINANIRAEKRNAALDLLRTLTSVAANVGLARAYGRSPARRAAYDELQQFPDAALFAKIKPMLDRAKSRPITPYYSAISDTLQSEFSAIVSGIRSPERALSRAQALVDHITGTAT